MLNLHYLQKNRQESQDDSSEQEQQYQNDPSEQEQEQQLQDDHEFTLQVNEFSLDQMCKNPSILIIGKRDSDRQKLVADLLMNFSHIPATIFNPSDLRPFADKGRLRSKDPIDQNLDYFSEMENVNIEKIYHKYDSEIFRELLKKQRRKKKKDQCTKIVRSDTMTGGVRDLLDRMKTVIESSLVENKLKCSDILDLQKLVGQIAECKRDHMISEQLANFSTNIHHIIEGSLSSDSLFELQEDYNQIVDSKKMNICDFLLKEKEETLKHVLVINDLSSIEFMKDSSITDIVYNARNYDLINIMTIQYPLSIPPSLRINFDYIFLFRNHTISSQKRLYEHYAEFLPDFRSFRQVYNQLTANGGCMVIKNTGNVTSFIDKIAYYNPKYQKVFD